MVDSVVPTIYIFTDFFCLVVLSIVERGVYDSCISKLLSDINMYDCYIFPVS